MVAHRYTLQPYKGPATKVTCPECRKPGVFTRYLDTQTGNLLPDHVGRCDREDHCGYHFKPRQYFEAQGPLIKYSNEMGPFKAKTNTGRIYSQAPARPVDHLPGDLVRQVMARCPWNNFTVYLRRLLGETVALSLIGKYRIGSSKHWQGATSFFQIDPEGNLRQVKIMLYDAETGKRAKSEYQALKWDPRAAAYRPDVDRGDKIYFAGKWLFKGKDANLVPCLFGAHLLNEYPGATVGIVESEKTAILASVFLPHYVWLATGGKNGARWTDPDVCRVLENRNIVLFPDLGAFDDWSKKAEQIKRAVSCGLVVSDLLETLATDEEKACGWDLADYLIRRDPELGWATTDNGYPVFWDHLAESGQ